MDEIKNVFGITDEIVSEILSIVESSDISSITRDAESTLAAVDNSMEAYERVLSIEDRIMVQSFRDAISIKEADDAFLEFDNKISAMLRCSKG